MTQLTDKQKIATLELLVANALNCRGYDAQDKKKQPLTRKWLGDAINLTMEDVVHGDYCAGAHPNNVQRFLESNDWKHLRENFD